VPAGPSTRRRRVKAGGFTANVDRLQIINFVPPAFLRLDVGCAPTGNRASHGRRAGGINMRNLNAIKPETETTSPSFWGQAHDWVIHNHATTDMLVEQIATAFLEDVAVLEAQQQTQILSTGDLLRERHPLPLQPSNPIQIVDWLLPRAGFPWLCSERHRVGFNHQGRPITSPQ